MRPKFLFIIVPLFIVLGLAACSGKHKASPPLGKQTSSPSKASTAVAPEAPVEYSLSADPIILPNGSVRIEIHNNIPGMIDVMASLSLHGQADNDTYIGEDERVRLSNGEGTVTFTASNLPKGKYDAEVSFYPLWGFQDSASRATGISKELDTSSIITLTGSGESAANVQIKKNGQKWVMEHVSMGDSWKPSEWTQKFGTYQELSVDRGNSAILKAYYFPRIDTTLIVNTLKGKITVWRLGKAHH